MPIRASQIFSFLEQHSSFSVERRELSSAVFTVLRRSLRTIIEGLHDGDDGAQEASIEMRMRLSEWLTVPVQFDDGISQSINTLGAPELVEQRWGALIRKAYDAALGAAAQLVLLENPVRAQLLAAVRELRGQNKSFKIYCHKRARGHFDSVVLPPADVALEPAIFLHSAKDYRETEPFDALIKVGPLRSQGWASAPDAIVAAPRYDTLIQIVWSGCGDEQGFGYDPVTGSPGQGGSGGGEQAPGPSVNRHHQITWVSKVVRMGDDLQDAVGDAPAPVTDAQPVFDQDEFQFFQTLSQSSDRRSAKLIQLDEDHGILYPAHARVLSFDPDVLASNAIGHRVPGDSLTDGMYVIIPRLGDVDLGGLHAGDGKYSGIWKARLKEELCKNPGILCVQLVKEGVSLLHLRAALENWSRPPTTVIHAPQHAEHFEVLIKVLGINFDPAAKGPVPQHPWWQYAWREIRRARGEAIQTGLHEQEIVEEQLVFVLRGSIDAVRCSSINAQPFLLPIPAGNALEGVFRFYPILSVEEGFRAPDNILEIIDELRAFEQWRA